MNSALNAAGTAALNALLSHAGDAAAQKRSWEEALGSQEAVQYDDGSFDQGSKFARSIAEGFRGKGWICSQCGNNNHDGRQICNMRYCQATRPMQQGEWMCSCGNINYSTRTACGLRKCGLPRPSGQQPQIEQIISSVMGQVGGGATGAAAAVQSLAAAAAQRATAAAGAPPAGPRTPPEGSWVCLACGNVNWPTRDTCNGRQCGLPRTEVDGGPYTPQVTTPSLAAHPAVAAQQQQHWQLQQQQHQQQQQQQQQQQYWQQQQPQQQRPPPEGSWSCLACGNINWPTRDTCNKRTCGRSRAEVDGGPPDAAAAAPQSAPPPRQAATQGTPPDGSWVCIECNNVNWPNRESCNKRTCGKPRAEVDGGPPVATA